MWSKTCAARNCKAWKFRFSFNYTAKKITEASAIEKNCMRWKIAKLIKLQEVNICHTLSTIRTKNLHDVNWCHTLSMIQTKNLHDVKLCHPLSTIQTKSLLIQVTGYSKQLALRIYIVDCFQVIPNIHMINKHKMHPSSREIRLDDVRIITA